MLPEALQDHWDGRRWRWWALLAGIVLTALTVAIAGMLTTVLAGGVVTLTLLGLTIEMLILSVTGSGMLDGLAGRAVAGGLARQPAEDVRGQRKPPSDADRARRDRRTIRAGLVVLPLFVTFVALLVGGA